MKCTFCRQEFDENEQKCPYCGTEVSLAQIHQTNMAQFSESLKKTEQKAEGVARKMEGLGKRAALLAVLLIGFVAMLIVTAINEAEPDMDAIRKKDALKNVTRYSAMMDDYLAQGDYVDFAAFYYSHEIPFMGTGYSKFIPVKFCASYYYECVRYLEAVIYHSTDESYHDRLSLDISHFAMYLCEFRDTCKVQKEAEKDPVYRGYIEDMNEDIRAMLRCYLHLDEGGVDELLALSEAKIAVRVEEVLGHE